MMKLSWSWIEPVAYLAAIFLAAFLRFSRLELLPLSGFEAGWAFQALQVARNNPALLDANPGYSALTAALFFILGDGTAIARLAPALAGVSLVLIPYVLRDHIGRTAALILAFGLAIDPFLVAYSRLAGGPMLAVAFFLWALVFFGLRKPIPSAIFAGLSLLSGYFIWQGILAAGAAWLVLRILPGSQVLNWTGRFDRSGWQRFGVFLVGTVLLVGTFMTLLPQGLGAFAGILPAYLRTWWQPSGTPLWQNAAALLVYQPLALLFGVIGGFRSIRSADPLNRLAALWALFAFILAVALPGRLPLDLAWVVLPLWWLASREIAHYFEAPLAAPFAVLLESVIIVLLLLVGWLNVASYILDGQVLRLYFTLGLFVVAVIATYLIGAGWSGRAALTGLVWGVCAGLMILVFGEALAPSRPRSGTPVELWQIPPASADVDLALRTLGDLSEWQTGRRDSLEMDIVAPETELGWYFRGFPNARYLEALASNTLPLVLFAQAEFPEPQLTLPYRGQNINWSYQGNWANLPVRDWLRWLFYRQMPVSSQQVTIWARGDVFPGGQVLPQSNSPVPELIEDDLPEDSPQR